MHFSHSYVAYSILPPPKSGKNIVAELVPIPNVRSTNNVVNSPYTTINIGIANDFKNVQKIPINIRKMSHFVAKRNCN